MLSKAKQSISEWDNVAREGGLRSAMNCAVGARLDSEYGQKPPNSQPLEKELRTNWINVLYGYVVNILGVWRALE